MEFYINPLNLGCFKHKSKLEYNDLRIMFTGLSAASEAVLFCFLFMPSSVQACDVTEKSCPDDTCKAQRRFNNRLVKCVCSTDLCNKNLTWSASSEEPGPTDSVGMTLILYLHHF